MRLTTRYELSVGPNSGSLGEGGPSAVRQSVTVSLPSLAATAGAVLEVPVSLGNLFGAKSADLLIEFGARSRSHWTSM